MDADTRELVEEDIRSLLGPFTDAMSILKITDYDENTLRVVGRRKFQDFDLHIQVGSDGGLVVPRKHGFRPLSHVMAETRFGNLDQLAKSMLPFLKDRMGEQAEIVQSRVAEQSEQEVDEGEGQTSQIVENDIDAGDAVANALEPSAGHGTSLTFLHGHAGAGKSWLLMHCALQQAHRYLQREDKRLFLYVDAQGVNLRSIELQISQQLDIYNGVLRFNEVVPLARLGMIGVIVDGFDELIMPSGYDDTLHALCTYLRDFRGEGAVLASARTAFFHTYDLVNAQSAMKEPIKLKILKMQPWAERQRQEYCATQSYERSTESKLEKLARSSLEASSLLGRPFVVSRVAELLEEGKAVSSSLLIPTIEKAYIEREVGTKLLHPDTMVPLITFDQFRLLLNEICAEMWTLRQKSIDVNSLVVVVTMNLEAWGIRKDVRDIVGHKIEFAPVLEPAPSASKERRVQFPHEVIFTRVFAELLLALLLSDQTSEIERLLCVAPVDQGIVDQFVDAIRVSDALGDSPHDDVLQRISSVAAIIRSGDDQHENLRRNLGSLVCGLLGCRQHQTELVLERLAFVGTGFANARLGGVRFRQCRFEDVDARSTSWDGVEFSECDPIAKLLVAPGQSFDASLPAVLWLVVVEEDRRRRELFGPYHTRGELFPSEAAREPVDEPPALSATARSVANLAERLARKALKTFWFPADPREEDSPGLARIRSAPEFRVLAELLEKHGLLETSIRQRSGTCAKMMHVKCPKDILEGHDAASANMPRAVVSFWEEVRSLT